VVRSQACGQTHVASWATALGADASSDIVKVGEGTFAEVFCGEFNGSLTVSELR
jgi:polygalacturonase